MQSGAWLTSVALERWAPAPALLIVFLPPPHLLYFSPRCKDHGWVSRILIAATGRVQLHCAIWMKKFVSSVGLLLKLISGAAQVFLVISDNEHNNTSKTAASRCWGAAACNPNWPDNNNHHHDEPTSAPLHRRKKEVSLTFLCCFSHAGSRRRSRSQSSSWCI